MTVVNSIHDTERYRCTDDEKFDDETQRQVDAVFRSPVVNAELLRELLIDFGATCPPCSCGARCDLSRVGSLASRRLRLRLAALRAALDAADDAWRRSRGRPYRERRTAELDAFHRTSARLGFVTTPQTLREWRAALDFGGTS